MSEISPGIISSAYCVPERIRYNDDPIFHWLHTHTPPGNDLFEGYEERRVLGIDEELMSIMLPASRQAIERADIHIQEIDFLLGTGSVSKYRNPNELSELHNELKLGDHVWPIPIDDAFSNFNSSLLLADSLIKTGRARNVLVCIGGNWTRNVSYQTSQAISAADGAAAFIVGDSRKKKDSWILKDSHTYTDSSFYGTMYTMGDEVKLDHPQHHHKVLFSAPYFHITQKGIDGFKTFGAHQPPKCAVELLEKNKICSDDITLISHQASTTLTDAWNDVIKPNQYINTIKKLANMALANVPVNLAWATEHEPIRNNYLVLLTIGPDMHTNALLFERA